MLVLAVVCLAAACNHESSAKPPPVTLPAVNLPAGDTAPLGVILITVDTLRADYLSSYGHARILTPSFDRLASGGILFKQAIAQSSTTTPSHASIMSSLYLQDHNVYTNFEALGNSPRTLAEIMAGRGFNTYAIVNMSHLNPEVSNLAQGFNVYVRSGNMRRAAPTIDKAVDWLEKNGEQPFFMWIHFLDCHTPYSPPPPYDRFYYDDDERDPGKRSLAKIWHFLPTHMTDHPFFQAWLEGITDSDWVMAQYQGAVTYADDEFGRLLDRLEEMGLLERTAVILTADHGESLGEHDIYYTHAGLYEQTIHVPLITYFPGAGRQGVQVREVVESIDIYPTVLEYFGIPIPKGIRGRSLWPLIRGEVQPERVAMSEHAGRNLVVLRTDRYKYIKQLRTIHLQPSYPWLEGREELYDLKTDALERKDLSKELPEVMKVFRKDLEKRRSERLNLQVGQAELTDETVEVLRAMGYVR
jgi:arylsulfatase